jgi:hypothetical protein
MIHYPTGSYTYLGTGAKAEAEAIAARARTILYMVAVGLVVYDNVVVGRCWRRKEEARRCCCVYVSGLALRKTCRLASCVKRDERKVSGVEDIFQLAETSRTQEPRAESASQEPSSCDRWSRSDGWVGRQRVLRAVQSRTTWLIDLSSSVLYCSSFL